ncbi:MAG: CHASE3 domain-containing protein [Kofleriaceae bacterium]
MGIVFAFALLGAVGIVTYAMTSRQVDNTRWVERSHTVIETVAAVSEHLADARRSERGFLLTGDRAQLAPYELAARNAREAVQELRTLTADNPRQVGRIDRLAPLVDAVLAHLAHGNAMRDRQAVDPDHVIALIQEGDARLARITPIVHELLGEERELLVVRDAVMAAGVTRTTIIQVAGTIVSFALVVLAVFGLRREIGRRVRSDAALRELNDELELRVQARTAELEGFSYSVAHDLRAPLRSLSGFSEILLEDYQDKLDAEGVDSLQRIRDNARKMAVLIDSLLSLSRIARSELKPATVDLSALVREVANQLQTAEPRAHIELVIADNVKANLPPDLARTLVEKLVENAWKYTSKLAATRIEFGIDTIEGQRTFFVRDNGAGFDMTHAAKLFVPFHRMHTDAEFPGTGIGLSIAQRIVARSGGKIWADGKVDAGAAFYFTLSEKPARPH